MPFLLHSPIVILIFDKKSSVLPSFRRSYLPRLDHSLFKNVFEGPAFLWQTQIQMIEYGLYDTIQMKGRSYVDTHLKHSDKNFETILMPKAGPLEFLS